MSASIFYLCQGTLCVMHFLWFFWHQVVLYCLTCATRISLFSGHTWMSHFLPLTHYWVDAQGTLMILKNQQYCSPIQRQLNIFYMDELNDSEHCFHLNVSISSISDLDIRNHSDNTYEKKIFVLWIYQICCWDVSGYSDLISAAITILFVMTLDSKALKFWKLASKLNFT